MKLSIITPSYNQGKFIERTILSVLDQRIPDLEYIIIDGKSSDATQSILDKYRHNIAELIIEEDNGQAEAINKGFKLASGEIIAWINSDDYYLPGIFSKVLDLFTNKDLDFIYGNAYFVDENDVVLGEYPSHDFLQDKNKYKFWKGWPIPQPSVFFRRNLIEKYSFLREDLNYAIDFEYFLRISQSTKLHYFPFFFANYRIHKSSKTNNWEYSKPFFYQESVKIIKTYVPKKRIQNMPLWISWFYYQAKQLLKNPRTFRFIR